MSTVVIPLATPTFAYQPPALIAGSPYQATLRLNNTGTSLIFVGGPNVSPSNGMPLLPGNKPLQFTNMAYGTVYTCCNSFIGSNTAAATLGTGTGLATIGTTKLTVTTMNSSFAAGTTLALGTGTNTEYVVVSSTATTVVTITNPTLLYHAVGDVMTVATSLPGQLIVTPGVV